MSLRLLRYIHNSARWNVMCYHIPSLSDVQLRLLHTWLLHTPLPPHPPRGGTTILHSVTSEVACPTEKGPPCAGNPPVYCLHRGSTTTSPIKGGGRPTPPPWIIWPTSTRTYPSIPRYRTPTTTSSEPSRGCPLPPASIPMRLSALWFDSYLIF